mmetsp:Transcript_14367/g.18239  ORF Transcript_14367/g.18239 Transcript_14367/m.18239 type:complete len:87 (+) Transcript_14367:482-742(+)
MSFLMGISPDEAVAYGATAYGALISDDEHTKYILLKEVLPMSLGAAEFKKKQETDGVFKYVAMFVRGCVSLCLLILCTKLLIKFVF